MHLSYLDLGIVTFYILFVFFSGYIVKKYVKGIDDYLVAGRSMGFSLGLVSLMCTEIGMITYIYYAELGYKAGFAGLMVAIPPVLAFFILGKTGFVIKALLDMKIATIPEFFSRRYSNGTRFYLGILMAIGGILNFGVFPGIEANFINIITGIPENHILLTMVGLLTIVLVYTFLGGMVSVITTNYVQYALLGFGMIVITIIGFGAVGWGNIVKSVTATIGEKGINPFSPTAFSGEFGIGFLLWQLLMQLALLVGWQAVSMRLFSSKDTQTGRKIYTWSALMFLSRAVIPVFWGIIALGYFTKSGQQVDGLECLPRMILALVPSGLLGLIFAGLLAASMSTYASYLLSWSSVVSQDIIGTAIRFITGKELSSKKQLLISRMTMASIMIFIIWWSLFHNLEGYLYFYLQMTAMLFIPGTFVCLVAGIYWKKARTLGAYLAITFGAMLPLIYLKWPSQTKAYASEIGWGGFVVALFGMIVGSILQNIMDSKKKIEVV